MKVMRENYQLFTHNHLFASLAEADFELLSPHLEVVDLPMGTVLNEAHEPTEYAYFPISGICSIIAQNADGIQIETGLIGREGFVGIPIVHYVDSTPSKVVVQAQGRALRISKANLLDTIGRSQSLMPRLLRFAHTFSVQVSQTALANGYFTINQRLARWLLMCQDRVDGQEFPMTHRFLAVMLAVRRAGITDALNYIEGEKAIRALRGRIIILNRSILEKIAGGAYGVPEEEYRRLIGSES
jgi:CRP-like cAMP-binding protein